MLFSKIQECVAFELNQAIKNVFKSVFPQFMQAKKPNDAVAWS